MDDEMYGLHSTTGADDDYADPHNLIINQAIDHLQYHLYSSMLPSGDRRNIPVFESEDLGFNCSASESISVNAQNHREHAAAASNSVIKAKIASHPCYPKLIDAYIDCQKVGAPAEIASLLDEIRREEGIFCKYPMSMGSDPELDEFMETYYDILVKYKSDLRRPFDEATSFLNKIETQLGNLCKDDGSLSSDDELSGGKTETPDAQTRVEDRELKDKLLRRYGSHISSLKLEFSKKKQKGKLPKESRQTLLEWWNIHYKWPYPTEADKISLAELTGLDQKQINNWFINQRKRHWKPSENMQVAIMNHLSGHFFTDD